MNGMFSEVNEEEYAKIRANWFNSNPRRKGEQVFPYLARGKQAIDLQLTSLHSERSKKRAEAYRRAGRYI